MSELQTHKQGPAWDYLQKWGYLKKRISGAVLHTTAIMHDGTAQVCGSVSNSTLENWHDLKEIICTASAVFALRNDGRVYKAGDLQVDNPSCLDGIPTMLWPNNIISISASTNDCEEHILGLSSDGHVYSFGANNEGQCNTDDWNDIVEIKAIRNLSVGVRKDGTVVACGNPSLVEIVSSWQNIEHIYGGLSRYFVAGLQFDGTVLIASINSETNFQTSHWRDIIDISCGMNIIAGIKGNGEVYFSGHISPEFERNGLKNILTVNVERDIVFAPTFYDTMWIGDLNEITQHTNLVNMKKALCSLHTVSSFISILEDGTVSVAILSDLYQTYGLTQTDGWKLFATTPKQPPSEASKKIEPRKDDVNDFDETNDLDFDETEDLDFNKIAKFSILTIILLIVVLWVLIKLSEYLF